MQLQAPSGVAAKGAYVLSVANDGSARRPQDQQVHPDGSMEAIISVLSRDKYNYDDMISEGNDADLDLSLRRYDRCRQVTFYMLPGFRSIMKELVDDQKRTADRIKMVDAVPNCKAWPQFLMLLTRAQEVVTDRDIKVAYKANLIPRQQLAVSRVIDVMFRTLNKGLFKRIQSEFTRRNLGDWAKVMGTSFQYGI